MKTNIKDLSNEEIKKLIWLSNHDSTAVGDTPIYFDSVYRSLEQKGYITINTPIINLTEEGYKEVAEYRKEILNIIKDEFKSSNISGEEMENISDRYNINYDIIEQIINEEKRAK